MLPVLAYAFAPVAIIARYTRASVVEALPHDHVRTAQGKGTTPPNTVLSRHVLRNAMLPIVTVTGPLVPDLITSFTSSSKPSSACPAWAGTG